MCSYQNYIVSPSIGSFLGPNFCLDKSQVHFHSNQFVNSTWIDLLFEWLVDVVFFVCNHLLQHFSEKKEKLEKLNGNRMFLSRTQ